MPTIMDLKDITSELPQVTGGEASERAKAQVREGAMNGFRRGYELGNHIGPNVASLVGVGGFVVGGLVGSAKGDFVNGSRQ